MKKILIFLMIFLLAISGVYAVSFYADANFKGLYKIYNVTNITFKDGTVINTSVTSGGGYPTYNQNLNTTASVRFNGMNLTGNLNMTSKNITSVMCIYFFNTTGYTTGSICG